MLRQKLIQSTQAGPFNATQNRMIDIDLASNQVISMADSFLVFTTRIINPSPSAMNLCVAVGGLPHITPFNVDLIRNASLTSTKLGKLEDRRRINVYSHNVMELSKSQVEKQSQVISLYQTRDNATNQLLSPFLNYVKTGDTVSTFRDVKLRVPLSQLFELGNQVLDLSDAVFGGLRIHLELESGFSFVVQNEPLFQGQVTIEGSLQNVISGSTFNVTQAYYTDADSPYCVGFQYILAYTNAANPPVEATTLVTLTQASYTANRTLQLTFAGVGLPLPDQGGGAEYSAISVVEAEALPNPAPQLQIALAECNVAEIVGQKPEKINQMTFTTWSTEEMNAGGQAFFSKAFIVEPECANVLCMLVGSRGSMLSNNILVDSYRIRVNGEDVTDRDVEVQKSIAQGDPVANADYDENYFDSTLHYDQLVKTFLNMNYPLKNYTQIAMSRDGQNNIIHIAKAIDEGGKYGVETNRLLILAAPTPITPTSKEVQININCRGDGVIENVILFKHLVKTVSF